MTAPRVRAGKSDRHARGAHRGGARRSRPARFVAAAGLQCGFCIPGIAMRAKASSTRSPSPYATTRSPRHLDVHLCRCTGYTKIVDAIELAGKAKRGECTVPPLETDGARRAEPRALPGARAHARRPAVRRRPDAARGCSTAPSLPSAHARARIIAIDVTQARALPGVVAVVTAKDVPGRALRTGSSTTTGPPFIGVGMTTSLRRAT